MQSVYLIYLTRRAKMTTATLRLLMQRKKTENSQKLTNAQVFGRGNTFIRKQAKLSTRSFRVRLLWMTLISDITTTKWYSITLILQPHPVKKLRLSARQVQAKLQLLTLLTAFMTFRTVKSDMTELTSTKSKNLI